MGILLVQRYRTPEILKEQLKILYSGRDLYVPLTFPKFVNYIQFWGLTHLLLINYDKAVKYERNKP